MDTFLQVQEGILEGAVKLIMCNTEQQALEKLGCWLLANVTIPMGSAAREQLLHQPTTLERLVLLAKQGQPGKQGMICCSKHHQIDAVPAMFCALLFC